MGWDGDDLAGSMEDAAERQQSLIDERQASSAKTREQRVRNSELESLRMSKSRVLGQLQNAVNPVHRAMLERALKSIEEKLSG
ncbi:MAG TPA: hypothetical protein VIR01_04975 [Pyrinomonadaceae bacterium]|jgi:ABC-type phosphate transport system auxiliary subunit|nr:hypothetical protein [Pyrinomonadaceae bacterium]